MNTVNSIGVPVETGKLFTGQGGLQILTATAHPVKITAGPGLPQIEVAGTGTRAVTINAPLSINGNLDIEGTLTTTGPTTITPGDTSNVYSKAEVILYLQAFLALMRSIHLSLHQR